jgi:hypothetical protein
MKNNIAERSIINGVNALDSMDQYAVLAPQFHRWRRSGNVITWFVDEISQGSTPVRDVAAVIDQFYLGCAGTGPDGAGSVKASSYSINAFGVTTGMSTSDVDLMKAYAYPRVGINWKKALNP